MNPRCAPLVLRQHRPPMAHTTAAIAAYRSERNTKTEKNTLSARRSMHSHQRQSFESTPLPRFFCPSVGYGFQRSQSRLNRLKPVF